MLNYSLTSANFVLIFNVFSTRFPGFVKRNWEIIIARIRAKDLLIENQHTKTSPNNKAMVVMNFKTKDFSGWDYSIKIP